MNGEISVTKPHIQGFIISLKISRWTLI